ncbi:MAG: hypothetical protein AUF79_05695 [Crenarchaeota archaeon 13_1_20CM_2_51_8]|nr:MAG: hypothetical protein AUI97_07265 [Crenarchaeota archaeon 13_1_40CM_3_52_17]OLE91245.1 MAG: hypothetical protein AUF79_05695 [Crenarchaeota archaeon 13_1_20CM_2_51_8]
MSETELKECQYCGRKVSKLVPVTADDIQRVYPPRLAWDQACEDCLPKIQAMSRVVPEYSLNRALGYLSTRVPILTAGLASLAVVVTVLSGGTIIARLSPSMFVGIVAVFTGLQIIWVRSRDRYGSTHDLRWSLNSRPVVRGLAVFIAGILVLILAAYLHF